MSDAVARSRQPVDVDEFERRLRGPDPGRNQSSDPLAELARLVQGAHEPAAPVVQVRQEPQMPAPEAAGQPALTQAHPRALDPDFRIPGVALMGAEAPMAVGAPRFDLQGEHGLAQIGRAHV